MTSHDRSYGPPAGLPAPDKEAHPGREGEGEDRLPPPVFAPGITRRTLHRAPHLPPPASALPPGAVYGPDDPPVTRERADRTDPGRSETRETAAFADVSARELRARQLAALLDRLGEELRHSGTLRFVPNPGSDTVEAALRGFLSGILLSTSSEGGR